MRILLIVFAPVLVGGFHRVPKSPPALQEVTLLRWKLKRGESLVLSTRSTLKASVKTTEYYGDVNQYKSESSADDVHSFASEMAVEVRDITAAGTAILSVVPRSIGWERPGSYSSSFSLRVRRNEAGKEEVSLSLPEAVKTDRAALKEFLGKLASNMIQVRVTVEVNPLGTVSGSKVEADLLKGLNADTVATKALREFIENSVSIEDVLGPVTSLAFVQVPVKPMKSKERWDTERTIRVMGLQASCKGKARIEYMTGARARIVEDVKITKVDTKRLGQRVEAMLRSLHGVEAKITSNLESTNSKYGESQSEFDNERGCAVSEERKAQIIVAGNLTVDSVAKAIRIHMEVRIEEEGRLTWAKP